jgi:hypothetical protein
VKNKKKQTKTLNQFNNEKTKQYHFRIFIKHDINFNINKGPNEKKNEKKKKIK